MTVAKTAGIDERTGLTAATITETTGSTALAKRSTAARTVITTDPMGVSIFLPFLEATAYKNTVAAGAPTEAALAARAVAGKYFMETTLKAKMNVTASPSAAGATPPAEAAPKPQQRHQQKQ